jgi:hypothetical protein
MEKPFEEQLAIAAAVWNSFRMVREDAERAERVAAKHHTDARINENTAFRKLVELAEKATLEPVNVHG